jgi:hypothetical protein
MGLDGAISGIQVKAQNVPGAELRRLVRAEFSFCPVWKV